MIGDWMGSGKLCAFNCTKNVRENRKVIATMSEFLATKTYNWSFKLPVFIALNCAYKCKNEGKYFCNSNCFWIYIFFGSTLSSARAREQIGNVQCKLFLSSLVSIVKLANIVCFCMFTLGNQMHSPVIAIIKQKTKNCIELKFFRCIHCIVFVRWPFFEPENNFLYIITIKIPKKVVKHTLNRHKWFLLLSSGPAILFFCFAISSWYSYWWSVFPLFSELNYPKTIFEHFHYSYRFSVLLFSLRSENASPLVSLYIFTEFSCLLFRPGYRCERSLARAWQKSAGNKTSQSVQL